MTRGRRFGKALGELLLLLVEALAVAAALYVAFALLLSTDEEKRLLRENRSYAARYSDMLAREALLNDAISDLQHRDNQLYESLFHSPSPALRPLDAADVIADSDTLSEQFLLSYGASKTENICKMADQVEDNFRAVFDLLVARRDSLPPLTAPVANAAAARAGASVGMKYSPVLRVELHHDGLDLIVPEGEPVLAAAPGRVSAVGHGPGHPVEIDHGNGYRTRYTCLGEVFVSVGMPVPRGKVIGKVGLSSVSFLPHLHYEVLRDGRVLDPVHFLLGSLSPDAYATDLFASATTGQSLE